MISLLSDARSALTSLRRRPIFVMTVVLTLGLGIGANAAVFSVVNAVLLQPLNLREPRTLASIAPSSRSAPSISVRAFASLKEKNSSFTAIAAYYLSSISADDEGIQGTVGVEFVTENYFDVLGVTAELGRTITPTDAGSPVVVLSEGYRRRRFGDAANILGQRVRLGGGLFTVIGVAPQSFRGIEVTRHPEVWVPISTISSFDLKFIVVSGRLNENLPILRLVGRLRRGTSHRQAEVELNRLDTDNVAITPSTQSASAARPTLTVVPIARAAISVQDPSTALSFVRLLFAIVALTLLLACVNVAGMLTLRNRERGLELGVRAALGAGTWRLGQHVLTETLLLALGGGGVGLGIAAIMIPVLSKLTVPGGLNLADLPLGINVRVAVFVVTASIVAAIIGVAGPAHVIARSQLFQVLRGNDEPTSRLRGRRVLISVQVGISLVLVVGASLFIRSLQHGLSADLGFDARELAAVSVQPHYDGRLVDNIRPYQAILAWMRSERGISSVAVGTHVPLSDRTPLPFTRGTRSDADREAPNAVLIPMVSVSADYFRTLGVPLLLGRQFDDVSDVAGAPRVTILNQSAARALWPNESPLGKQISLDHAVTYTVVGVVRDTKYRSVQDRDVPFAFAPMGQEDFVGFTSFIVRSRHPRAALSVLEHVVRSVAPDLQIPDSPRGRPRLVTEQLLSALAPQRFGATLLSMFAVIALAVAAVGIYGGVAYVVVGRHREIGIRMALGAQPAGILRLVLVETGAAVAVGIGTGVAGAAIAAALLRHLLRGIQATDWVAFFGAVTVVLFVAVVAAAIPGARATRVDPNRVMRLLN